MWFDLALALGMTVTDLKARMPMSEFGEWFAYVELYGPVDYRRRYDEPAALVASTVSWSVGGKRKYADFIRKPPTPYNADEMTDVDLQILNTFRKRT